MIEAEKRKILGYRGKERAKRKLMTANAIKMRRKGKKTEL